MPNTEALITVKGTGGDQAAREMKKPAQALDDIGKEHKKLGDTLSKRVEPLMLREAMRQMIQMTGVGAEASGMLRMMSLAFRGLYAALGPVGLAITAVVTVIGLARSAYALYGKLTRDSIKDHDTLAASIRKTREELDKYERLGGKLTPELQKYRTVLELVGSVEKARRIDLNKSLLAQKEAERQSLSFRVVLRSVSDVLFNSDEGLKANIADGMKARGEMAELEATLVTLRKAGLDVNEWLTEQVKRIEVTTAATREYSRAIVDAGSDNRTYYENEQLNINRWYEDKRRALDDAKADQEAYTRLNEARAARERRLNRDVQQQFAEGWMSATAGAQASMSSFAASIIGHANNVTAAWGKFRDSLMRWMEELAAKALVTGLFSWMLGGVGGFMGGFRSGMGLPAMPVKQWGGVIPGPEGAPRLALVHGGETFTNSQGMGGGPGGGGSSLVFSPIFTGGIGNLDSRSQRMIVRQLRRLVKSVGERPLA